MNRKKLEFIPIHFLRNFAEKYQLTERMFEEARNNRCVTLHDVLMCGPDSFSPSVLTELKRIFTEMGIR